MRDVYLYLEQTQDRILDHWVLPPDGLANREVVVRFTFAGDGSLERARIVSATDHRLKQSVAAAILRAAPFPPVPSGARCLVGLPIQTTFRNPAD